MTVSSRTPEGWPVSCPICGQEANLEPCEPGGDAICPSCGSLLWWFRQRLGKEISLDSLFVRELQADSLDVVEAVMELEEEFGVNIPDDEAQNIQTIADAIRYIRRQQGLE